MTDNNWVYVNGAFVRASDARISPFDRGFLFAQAAYEVTAIFDGKLIDFQGHIRRLQRTLAGVALPSPLAESDWLDLHRELMRRNGVTEGLIYLQVSGGAYGSRDFAGPATIHPSIFMFSVSKPLIGEKAEKGIAAILLPDTRWSRRDLKTTQLVSQALAYREAKSQGAATAIMHEDGVVTEAASANVWIVTDQGDLQTRDLSQAILPGITRAAVLSALSETQTSVVERAFNLEALKSAKEVFSTSSGALIAPIVEIDGKQVGDGAPGPTTRKVQRLFYQIMGVDLANIAPWL